MDFDNVDSLLKHFGVGRLSLDDPFFNETHEECKVFRRTGITVDDDEDLCHSLMKEFQCSAPHCENAFRNLADYEIHYNSTHRYSCEECKITRSNPRQLEIHIQENHDSFFDVVSQKRSMYQCYVPECNEKFASSDKRKIHCTKIHKFPENFSFDSQGQRNIEADSTKVQRDKDIQSVEIPVNLPISGIPHCCGERLGAFEYLHDISLHCDYNLFKNIDEQRLNRRDNSPLRRLDKNICTISIPTGCQTDWMEKNEQI